MVVILVVDIIMVDKVSFFVLSCFWIGKSVACTREVFVFWQQQNEIKNQVTGKQAILVKIWKGKNLQL